MLRMHPWSPRGPADTGQGGGLRGSIPAQHPAGPRALAGHLEGLGLEAEEPLTVGLALARQLRARKREVGVAAEVLTVEIDPVPLRAEPLGLRQDAGQSHDVAQRHLQRLVLGQLFVLAPLRHHPAQPVEGRVEPLHAAPLARVGRQPPARRALQPPGPGARARALGARRARGPGARPGRGVAGLAGLHPPREGGGARGLVCAAAPRGGSS